MIDVSWKGLFQCYYCIKLRGFNLNTYKILKMFSVIYIFISFVNDQIDNLIKNRKTKCDNIKTRLCIDIQLNFMNRISHQCRYTIWRWKWKQTKVNSLYPIPIIFTSTLSTLVTNNVMINFNNLKHDLNFIETVLCKVVESY